MPDYTVQDQALLDWLGKMDDAHVTTGLLAKAFKAGWHACEAARAGERDQ